MPLHQSDALERDSPELDFNYFCQLVEPVLIEMQEAERCVVEAAAPPTDADVRACSLPLFLLSVSVRIVSVRACMCA